MLAACDVHYDGDISARAAYVVFENWEDSTAAAEHVAAIADVQPYEPGQFYRRELPCVLEVLAKVTPAPTTIVIDGFVWLDGDGRRGLGAHLYEALNKDVAVIGVAKTAFHGAPSVEVLRGTSQRPLHITAAGIPATQAAAHIAAMHGDARMPTLLKRVDRLARGG